MRASVAQHVKLLVRSLLLLSADRRLARTTPLCARLDRDFLQWYASGV